MQHPAASWTGIQPEVSMNKEQALAVFENYKIRRIYDEKSETWFFSVVDIIAALIQQPDYQAARNYWKVLKNRLNKEGSQTVTKCNRLKMVAEDGKMRMTDVADPETLLRIVQSVPSPKAEPIKLWLARVGYERMQDMSDPARSLDRAREYWKQHGRSEKWIQQRMMGQETRNKLTDYWQDHEIKGGKIAKKARLELEQKTGRRVVTGENFLPPSSSPKKLR
jgi:hypothetical protein